MCCGCCAVLLACSPIEIGLFFSSKWLKMLDHVPFAVFALNPNQCTVSDLPQLLALGIQKHDLCAAAAARCFWPAQQLKNGGFFTSKWLKTPDYVPFAVFALNPNQCRVSDLPQLLALGIQEHDLCAADAVQCFWPAHQLKYE